MNASQSYYDGIERPYLTGARITKKIRPSSAVTTKPKKRIPNRQDPTILHSQQFFPGSHLLKQPFPVMPPSAQQKAVRRSINVPEIGDLSEKMTNLEHVYVNNRPK
jgi:hypothetical protein